MALDTRLQYPKEGPLFVFGVIFSSLVWLALVVSIVGIAYGLIVLIFCRRAALSTPSPPSSWPASS